jgi:hypothetical protein
MQVVISSILPVLIQTMILVTTLGKSTCLNMTFPFKPDLQGHLIELGTGCLVTSIVSMFFYSKLVDLILAGQEEAKKFEEDLNQAIAPLDATPSEEKAKFKIKNGLISDRIAVPYIVKDSDVGTVSIEMHYIKTEAGLTHTCPY